jgi:outer membrane protein TolC
MKGQTLWSVFVVFIWIVALHPAALAQPRPPGATLPPPDPAQAGRLSLDELITELERVNPELRMADYEVHAARARIRPAGALPDPTVNYGQMNVGNIVPFTTLGEEGFSEIYVGFHQEFPFYGKRKLREGIATKEADAERWSYQFTRLRVLSELKVAYYDLSYWHEVRGTLARDMRLLEKFAETAAALYRVGKGNQADVLRAQAELSRLQNRIEIADQSIGVAQAMINALLNRPADSPLARPEPLGRSAFRYSLPELLQFSQERFPPLREQEQMIEGREYGVQLAKKEKWPDFGFVFAYHNRGQLRDYWTIGGTARIPLWYGRKQKHEVAEAEARLGSAREKYESLRSKVRFGVQDYYLQVTTSGRLLTLYEKTIVPQDTLTLEATAASYQVGAIEFLSVVDGLLKLVDDELAYYQHLANYQKALARLEPLVGMELTR